MEIDSNEVEKLLNEYERELIDYRIKSYKRKCEAVVEMRKRFRALVDETVKKNKDVMIIRGEIPLKGETC